MTASIHVLRTQLELPPSIENGNPDVVQVFSDFPNNAAKGEWIKLLADTVAAEQGAISAQSVQRLASRTPNLPSVDEFGVGSILVRSVACLRRPSGRIVSLAMIHTLVHAEWLQKPEGSYVELRFGAPVVFSHNPDNKHEALEAALHHSLVQLELAARSLATSVKRTGTECTVWSLPRRFINEPFMTELNSRLVKQFYGFPPCDVQQLAA